MAMQRTVGRLIPCMLSLTICFGAMTPASANELYRARTFVTGQIEPNRSQGFAQCLTDVLVKVSGDPRLTSDTRLDEITAKAATFVRDFKYRDLMSGIPVHDEQGTRDRPYELSVSFDPGKVDAALRSLGREPWTASRPRVAVFVGVQHVATSFALAGDETRGPGMLEALADAATGVGIPIVVPDKALLATAGFGVAMSRKASPSGLEAAAKTAGGDLALLGTLTWSKTALGWIADWRMDFNGKTHGWQIRGVNFDDAFRSGMRGAVQILAGQGEPG